MIRLKIQALSQAALFDPVSGEILCSMAIRLGDAVSSSEWVPAVGLCC